MAKIIIGIHGLGNKPEAYLLEEWWLQSINEGLEREGLAIKKVPFKIVYWADILHSKPESLEITDKEDPLFLSEPYIQSDLKKNKPDAKTLYRKFLKFVERQLDNFFLKKDMTLKFSKVTNRLIHNYFEDLGVYYSDDCKDKNNPKCIARLAIRQRLFKVLKRHFKDDILLIGHSMGSIIGYDVLVGNIDDTRVNTFISIGSPLGIPIIGSKIFKEQKALRVPPNISYKWHNLSDPEDLVAMDHTIKDDFLENENMITIKDTLVFNDYEVNEKRNPHKIYGYLRTPEMARIIYDHLKKEESKIVKQYNVFKNKIKKLWKTKLFRRKK